MREFELVIDQAFKHGLSPITNPPTNSQLLWQSLGFRCKDEVLVAAKQLTNPLPVTLDMYYSWPYPQYIVGDGYNVLVIKNPTTSHYSIYSISDDHQTVTLLFDITELNNTPTLFNIADFGEYVFMTNGDMMVYWDPESSIWTKISESQTIPNFRTVENFKGQAIGGCVLSDWYDCDETFYIWSKIGSMDFTIDNDNEAGYRRCPYGGEVYQTRRLNDLVVGYSSKGITLLYPGSSKTPEYGTVATFGFKELSDIGLINRGAINGTLQRHLYVGEDYILREITSNGIKELGYQYYIQLLAGEDIIISYDPSEKEFYIGNSTKTFLFRDQGMSEVLQHPSAVWRRNKETYMLPSTVDSSSPYICTGVFDMQYRGQKTTFTIETDASNINGGEAGVDWSNDYSTWSTDNYQYLNDAGITANIVAGVGLRFRLKFSSLLEDAKISYLKLRYKMTDLRGLRGVYAPPPRGQ